MASLEKALYRIRFRTEESVYELCATNLYQTDMIGFVVIEGITFRDQGGVIANPAEERLRDEFKDSEKVYIPMHAIIRIDQVREQRVAKILPLDSSKALYPLTTQIISSRIILSRRDAGAVERARLESV